MRRIEVSPAAIGSLALHAGVAAALMISWGARDLKVGAVTPVTIVSSAPDLDTRPAIEGPTEQTALTETPTPDAPVTPQPPTPQPMPPTPAPPTPTPKVAPTPKAAPPTPAPKPAPPQKSARPATKQADSQDFFASLEQTLSKAPRGANRPATSPTPRNTAGSGLAAGADMQGLVQELQRRWNPNCEVEGGRDVVVRVVFNIGSGGQLVGQVTSEIRQGGNSAVARTSAERAERAVYAASPFRGLSRDYYGQRIAVNFNAREACAAR